jgi:hypothetical protein
MPQEIAVMVRITRLVAAVVAVVMTAFTFGLIGEGAAASTDIQSMPVVSHFGSEALVGTEAMLRNVLIRLV